MFRAVAEADARRTLVALAAVIAFAAAGCGGASGAGNDGGGNQPPAPPAPPPPTANVSLQSNASLGNYLVSADGRTLYYFALDVPAAGGQAAVSNCNANCLPFWPIFHVDAAAVGTGLNAADFAELVRPDGAKQTTYKGWPLYFFAGDQKAGDTLGDNLGEPRPTDLWFVIKAPFYSALIMTKDGGPAEYLADPAGRTLYVDAQDTVTPGSDPVSNCTGACLTTWPVFAAADGSRPTGIDTAKLTTFTRADGAKQSAFDGHPLYYFVGDTLPGQTNGRGIAAPFDTVDPTTL
jgi:predicted lipoprotein with Yx(FWY)xxD motif